MELYQNTTAEAVTLDWNMALLAHTIIKVNFIYIRYPSGLEKSLARKIEIAKNNLKPGRTIAVYLTNEEKERMRRHNTDYCHILAHKLMSREELPEDSPKDILEIYNLATKLNLLFSSAN